MKDRNLQYLEKHWLKTTSAAKALKHFRKWSPKRMKIVLRHHDEEDITNKETWWRDEFDYLLAFYGVVEIAVMIGFVPTLPTEFKRTHLPVLESAALTRYYEKHYVMRLPSRLRQRLKSRLGIKLSPSDAQTSVYYEFLALTKFLEEDEDMEAFLWALDGGDRDECDMDDVIVALKNPQRLFKAIQRRKKESQELDFALRGFSKFIDFCVDFLALMQREKLDPRFLEAMWLAHAYWFRRMRKQVGSRLKQAIRSLKSWTDESAEDSNRKAVEARIAELEKVVNSLASPLRLRRRKLKTTN